MFVPAKRLFIVVNVVFCCFPSSAGDQRERARWQEVVPIVWRISFSRRRGRVARGKPQGFALPLYAGRVAGSAAGAAVAASMHVATSRRSAARWAVRPADPPRGSVAQRAAALVSAATLVSAARGGRLEGGREGEVGGELHRARVLRAAVAPLVEGEAGLRGGLDGLRAALVEGAAARDATLALVGRADRQRALLRLRRAARVGGASRVGGALHPG